MNNKKYYKGAITIWKRIKLWIEENSLYLNLIYYSIAFVLVVNPYEEAEQVSDFENNSLNSFLQQNLIVWGLLQWVSYIPHML